MIFFDTNILIYFSINQDEAKQKIADKIILQAIVDEKLLLSPLILTEFTFVLSKLNQIAIQKNNIEFFAKFSKYAIDTTIVTEAIVLGTQLDYCKNISDLIHLKFAEKHCHTLVTFDNDFEQLKPYTSINIDVLKSIPND